MGGWGQDGGTRVDGGAAPTGVDRDSDLPPQTRPRPCCGGRSNSLSGVSGTDDDTDGSGGDGG